MEFAIPLGISSVAVTLLYPYLPDAIVLLIDVPGIEIVTELVPLLTTCSVTSNLVSPNGTGLVKSYKPPPKVEICKFSKTVTGWERVTG